MKRILGYIAAALAVLSLLLLVPSEDALGEIVPIPLDPKAVGPEINEKYYLSDTLYEDPSLHVELETGRMFDSAYIVARIRIADPSQIRSVMSTLDGKGTTKAKNMVKRANGVFAINGDFFRKNQPSTGKYIVRQGNVKQSNANKRQKTILLDTLVIDDKGDFHVIPHATNEDVKAFKGTIVNTYAFGPGLIIDGKVNPELENDPRARSYAGHVPGKEDKVAQRIAICQTGKLEYLCVVTSGPDHANSKGMTIPEFVELLESIGGIQTAYNLDGGMSCNMVFHGEKINSFGSAKDREISDIICFCSAWQE